MADSPIVMLDMINGSQERLRSLMIDLSLRLGKVGVRLRIQP